jgi:asparagine synthase (glutamine-hydrolysing)
MCGFIGFWGSSPNVDLERVARFIRHRGPDDEGTFESGEDALTLVHTRLSILDPTSSGHQPMASKDGKVVLVYNGEIFNYRKLKMEIGRSQEKMADGRRPLGAPGSGCGMPCALNVSSGQRAVGEQAGTSANGELPTANNQQNHVAWRGNSDTEVLLRLYLHYKKTGRPFGQMLKNLNGNFAFAVWDAESEELLLARDAFGVKPLYYAASKTRFVFGSEIKAMLPLLDGQAETDKSSIDKYLTYLWCPGDGTPDQRIRKMNPGEFIRVKNRNIIERKQWYQLPIFRSPIRSSSSEHILAKETTKHLRQAVHRQMVSDVPLGAFLSGGLDSSAVVTFARELDPKIRCFTIDTGETGQEGFVEDLPYARNVADHLKVNLEVIKVNPEELIAGLEDMVYHLDEPLADPASLNVLFISRLARRHGIKVLLSGAGGDDVFSGYRRHRALGWLNQLNRLPPSLRKTLALASEKLPQDVALARRLTKILGAGGLEGDHQVVQLFRWIGKNELASFYSKSFREALDNSSAEQPMLEFLAGVPNDASPLDRLLALEQRFFLADHNLLYTDKMSMAEGVEVRVPFLDIELVEFAARIPDSMKQRGREGKWILKKAIEPYLPREVIYRPKSGFGVPLRRWLRVEMRDWLADMLSVQRLKNRGFFEPSAVQRLIRGNETGRVDAAYTLFSLACVEIWCQKFVDGR